MFMFVVLLLKIILKGILICMYFKSAYIPGQKYFVRLFGVVILWF